MKPSKTLQTDSSEVQSGIEDSNIEQNEVLVPINEADEAAELENAKLNLQALKREFQDIKDMSLESGEINTELAEKIEAQIKASQDAIDSGKVEVATVYISSIHENLLEIESGVSDLEQNEALPEAVRTTEIDQSKVPKKPTEEIKNSVAGRIRPTVPENLPSAPISEAENKNVAEEEVKIKPAVLPKISPMIQKPANIPSAPTPALEPEIKIPKIHAPEEDHSKPLLDSNKKILTKLKLVASQSQNKTKGNKMNKILRLLEAQKEKGKQEKKPGAALEEYPEEGMTAILSSAGELNVELEAVSRRVSGKITEEVQKVITTARIVNKIIDAKIKERELLTQKDIDIMGGWFKTALDTLSELKGENIEEAEEISEENVIPKVSSHPEKVAVKTTEGVKQEIDVLFSSKKLLRKAIPGSKSVAWTKLREQSMEEITTDENDQKLMKKYSVSKKDLYTMKEYLYNLYEKTKVKPNVGESVETYLTRVFS